MRNNTVRSLASAAALVAGTFTTPLAMAGLVATQVTPTGTVAPNTIGGYDMTAFELPVAPGSATSATSLDGDTVYFQKKDSAAAQSMIVGDNESWWSGSSDTFYKASTNVNWVELIMPTGTTAFSMTLDASSAVNAWLLGVDSNNNAIDTRNVGFDMSQYPDFNPAVPFSIKLRNGTAQTWAFHADNSGTECSTIEKVIVDPVYWAMGDFAIHVDEDACSPPPGGDTGVPEPGTSFLGLLGLLALAGLRRRA